MFDKFKARIEKLEEDHDSVRKAHQHVVKYQVVYATVGGSAFTLVVVKIFGKPQVIVTAAENLPAVVNNTIHNTPVFNNTMNNGGHMRKIVRCLETDQLWPSMSKAAEDVGTSLHKMSQHVNGHKEHVDGLHYVIEGLATG